MLKRFVVAVMAVMLFGTFAFAEPSLQDAQLQLECENVLIEVIAADGSRFAKAEQLSNEFNMPKKAPSLWSNGWFQLLVAGQVINGANMNYQQAIGYYEKNDWLYGRHPSPARVWAQKFGETFIIYKVANKLEKPLKNLFLIACNGLVWYYIKEDFKDDRLAWNFRLW